MKCTEAILSDSTRKLLWFEITKMLIAALKSKFTVLFIIISTNLCRKKYAICALCDASKYFFL